MEAMVTYNYYMDQRIRIMEELVSQQKDSINMEDIQNLSPEEREKKMFELKMNFARLEAGQDIETYRQAERESIAKKQ